MSLRDTALALIVVVAWGTNFTAMRLALDELPPLLFVGLRFGILVPLVFFLPRSAPWRAIIAVGALINMGQFALLFSGMTVGMSAGLASLIIQSQAPITILLAFAILGERVNLIQTVGIGLASLGLAGFAVFQGGNVTAIGLVLVLLGAVSWAIGNLFLRRLPDVKMLPLFVWASLVPPLPMLAISMAVEGTTPWASLAGLSVQGWAAVVYVAVVSTIVGYSIWGTLLSRHAAAQVTPFALLIPVVGIATAALVLGERIEPVEAVSGAVVLAGLTLAVLGARRTQKKGA